MRTTAAVTLSVVMLVATVAAVPLVGVAQTTTETATATPTGTTGENTTAPGEQFAGVVGVQAAEVNGEIETRRFETRLDRAGNATERARVVAETTNDTEGRLAELRERRERIEAAHENGSLSDGQYRAQLARLSAEIRTTERMANRSAEVTESLPEEAVEASGLNRSAVEEVRRNARELGGQKVAEAARDIAGHSDDPPRGPPDERGSNDNESDDDSGPGNVADAPGRSNDSQPGNASGNESAMGGDANATERGESGDNGPPEERQNDGDESADRKAPTENRKNGGSDGSDDARGNGDENGANGADDGSDGDGDGEENRQTGDGNPGNGGSSGDNRDEDGN